MRRARSQCRIGGPRAHQVRNPADTAPPWRTRGRCRWWRCARRQLRAGWPVFQPADAVGHDAPVHVARRVNHAVGEQAGITGIELPVAPELAPWGYAERRLAFARPDLGRRRFHVVARHLQKARQFASLSRSAAYQPAILPHCDGGGTSRRNLQRQGMGSLRDDAVIQHGRPAQVYGAQERVGAISTWSKLSGQAQSWGFRTHIAMFTRSEMAGWRFRRVIAHHRRCRGPVPKDACPAAPADRAQPPRAALLRCGEP